MTSSRRLRLVLQGVLLATVACAAPRDPDPTVWVNTDSGVYHCPGSRFFEATAEGQLAPESTAHARGYRPADGYFCGDSAVVVTVDSAATAADTSSLPENPGPNVWVNSASGIYHCQGSQYYRATADGELMPERSAVAAGHRPAVGRSCF